LDHIISELIDLFDGVEMLVCGRGVVTVRAAVFIVIADSPARVKVMGFPSWNGRYGCCYCFKRIFRIFNESGTTIDLVLVSVGEVT
jgi:hypothetical protein